MPVEMYAMLAPFCGTTTVPNLLATMRARMSDGPLSMLLLRKRGSHRSSDCARESTSLLPPLLLSHVGSGSSIMPLQSSSWPLPGTSIAPGFTVGLQSSQSPCAGV